MAIQESFQQVVDFLDKHIPEEIYNYIPESKITRTLLIGTTTGFIAYLLFKKRYKLPPGPLALPIIGNTSFVDSKKSWAILCGELAKEYGPVFTVYLGMQRVVVLNDIESVNEALLKKGASFSNRMYFYSAHQMLHNGEDIIFDSYGTPWKLRRKLASRAIRLFMSSGNFDKKIEEAVSKTVDAMLKETGAFDPKPYLFYTVLNIIAGMCFSKSYAYGDPEYWELLNNLEANTEVVSEGVIFENVISWFAGIYTTQRYKKIEKLMESFLSLVERYVEQHKANFKPGQINDLTDSLLQAEIDIAAEGKDNMEYLQPIHIILIIFDVFFAGNDTSRATLLWTLNLILSHPGVQQKIQDEVDESVGRSRYPTTSDRENLPYTDGVLHESMRLRPVAPMGVPHATSCDTTLGDYEIPKGTTVMINHYALHTDPDKWSNVDKFQPERYLDEHGKMAPKPENWFPFSAGRRVCLGEPLAKPELHLILASLFQRLEFSPEPGTKIDSTPDLSTFVFAVKPFKVVVKKRF